MSYRKTLIVIMIIAVAGVLFSGYLSYLELFTAAGCADAPITCGPNGTPGITILSLPACVYGFIMYSIVLALSSFSLFKNRK